MMIDEGTKSKMNQGALEMMVVILQGIARRLDVLGSRLEAVENDSHKEEKERDFERERRIAELARLREEDSYYAYVNSFVSIAGQVDLSEEEQVCLFVEGLKEGSTKLIKVLNPKTLQHAITFGSVLAAKEDPYRSKGRVDDRMVSPAYPVSWSKVKQESSTSGNKTWQDASKEPVNWSIVRKNRGWGGDLQLHNHHIPTQLQNHKHLLYQPPHKRMFLVDTEEKKIVDNRLEKRGRLGSSKKDGKDASGGQHGSSSGVTWLERGKNGRDDRRETELKWFKEDNRKGITVLSPNHLQQLLTSANALTSEEDLYKIRGMPMDQNVSVAYPVPDFNYVTSGVCDQQIKEVNEVNGLSLEQPKFCESPEIAQPKNVLLYGLSGTKKTLLAKVVVHHIDDTFIGELFAMAKKLVPSIIFMEEIDGIGFVRRKFSSSNGDSGVQRNILEFQNRHEGLEALLRPGQIVVKFEFPNPNKEFRLDTLKFHSGRMNCGRGIGGTMQGKGFEALYEYSPPMQILYIHETIISSDVETIMDKENYTLEKLLDEDEQGLVDKDVMLQLLPCHLPRVQNRMRQGAPKKGSKCNFQVGDWMKVKLQLYRQVSVSEMSNQKLKHWYYGHICRWDKTEEITYRQQLPNSVQTHYTFHIPKLKKSVKEGQATSKELSIRETKVKLLGAILDREVDHGGNLIDTTASLAALLTFQRSECTLGEKSDQEIIVHLPEARESLPFLVHYLPIAVTFALLDDKGFVVVDPTHLDEAVLGGRMTSTLNTDDDVCAIHKEEGVIVPQSVIMHCLRIDATKAGDMTSKINEVIDAYNRDNKVLSIGGNCHRNMINNSLVGSPSSWDPYSNDTDTEFLRLSLASRANSKTPKRQEEVQVERQGYFTWNKWCRGLKMLKTYPIDQLKKVFPELEKKVKRHADFTDPYAYAFRYCWTEGKHKRIGIEISWELSNIALGNQLRVQLGYLIEYPKAQYNYNAIYIVQWQRWDPKAVSGSSCSIYRRNIYMTPLRARVLSREGY